MKKLLLALSLLLPWPAPAAPIVLTILHTNDMHGHVLSNAYDSDAGPGGLARIVTMIRAIREKTPDAILLDAGDAVQGTPTEFFYQGETMTRAMNAAGYDAATFGNHEFDWTQTATEVNMARARFPMVSANVRDRATDKPFGGAAEYTVITRHGVRVAVFGLTTLETPDIEWPRAISRVRFDDPTATARRLVPILRKKADVVLCLSHLGLDEDKKLAQDVPGMDLIIGGHSHNALRQRVSVGKCVIAQAGSYANYLGRVDIRLDQKHGRWTIVDVNGANGQWWPAPWPQTALIPVTEDTQRDPAVVAAYGPAWNAAKAMLAETLGAADTDIPARGTKDTLAVPRLLAGLLRQTVHSNVTIMPIAYGPSVPAGPVTNGLLYNVVGGFTRQNVVLVRATGSALRAAVETAYNTPKGTPVQFSGVGGIISRTNGIARWTNPTVNGSPLDDTALYTVAAGAFPMMDFPTLMQSTLLSDHIGWVKPLLAMAIRDRKALAPEPQTLVER